MSASITAIKVGGASGVGRLDCTREYVLIYLVETTDPADGSIIVGNCPGMPRRGYVYGFGNEYDLGALCQSVTPRQISKLVWEVTCQFSSKTEDPDQNMENPLVRPPRIEWDAETFLEPYERDANGKAVLNAAGDPFRAPLEREASRLILRFTRNEATFSPIEQAALANKCNADTFMGAGPGCAKLSAPKAVWKYENDVGYWEKSYEIKFDSKGWNEHPANMGCRHYAYRVAEPGGMPQKVKVLAEDENGVVSTEPVHLRADGWPLEQSEIEAGNIVYLDYQPYERIPFGPLFS
ncbi:MAG: hypothetical protein JW809_14990 [Pirellulales bacterium]|nr:hypothetical protein [Pirellulales bacterium]